MTDKQLKELEQFLKDGIYAEHKDNDKEFIPILNTLKSLGVISNRNGKSTLEIKDLVSFEKLIELKSINDFKKWFSDKDKSISLNINNSTIGQVNQSSNFSKSPQTINITPNNTNAKTTSFGIKFWELISNNKLISGFILIIIGYLIKIVLGIKL